MACRTTLILDPELGLKAHFKKLGVTVPCHIGPTGALRIPLCKFSEKQLEILQQECQHETQGKEFEVLRTDLTGSTASSTASPSLNDAARGDGILPQTTTGGTNISDGVDVEVHHEKAALCDPPLRRDQHLHGSTWSSSSTRRSTTTSSIESYGIPLENVYYQGDLNDLGTGGQRSIRPGSDHTRAAADDGHTAQMRPPRPSNMPTVCVLHGEEQSEAVLEVPIPSATTVPILQVDGRAAPAGLPEVPEPKEEGLPRIIKQPGSTTMPTFECVPTGDQRPQDPGKVHGLRHHSDRPEDREGHPEGEGETEEEPDQVRVSPRTSSNGVHTADTSNGPEDHSLGSSGDRRCMDRSDGGQFGDPVELENLGLHEIGNRRGRRLLRQAKAALSSAHEQWQDIMTCFQKPSLASGECLETFLCTIEPDQRAKWGPKKIRRLASLLGVQKRQAKLVAEVYNPNRFQPRTTKWGLQQERLLTWNLVMTSGMKVLGGLSDSIFEIRNGVLFAFLPHALFFP